MLHATLHKLEQGWMYDIKELEAFAAVVRNGSLTVSAGELDLPKSTLSRRIRTLEEAVGQPLLRRESNQVIPNEAGQVFYRYCDGILGLARQGLDALDELRQEISGELVLRSHEAFIRGWFAGVVEGFLDRHPEINVAVHTQAGAPGHDMEDVCIWLGRPGKTRLRQEPLGSLSQGVYGHPDYFRHYGHPRTPAELDTHPWIDMLGGEGRGLTLQHSRLGSFPLSLPGRGLRVDQFCLQGDAIAKQRGLGLMPHWLVQNRLSAHPGTFELCLPEWQGPSLPVWLLYPHGALPRKTRAFLSHVRQSVPLEWSSPNALPGADTDQLRPRGAGYPGSPGNHGAGAPVRVGSQGRHR